MTDPIEEGIKRTLRGRADEMPPSSTSAMIDGAIRRGRLTRRRHRVTAGVATAFVFVAAAPVVAGALDRNQTSVVIQPAGPATSSPTSTPSAAAKIVTTPCREVKEPARDVERDTVLDADAGVIELRYRDAGGVERYYAIDYRDDETCQQSAGLRALIEHVLEASRNP